MRLKATSYLKLAGRTWWFSKKVPWQKKRLMVNLHTSDLKVAQQKRSELLARIALGKPPGPDFDAEAAEVFLDPPRYVGDPHDETEPSMDGDIATEVICNRTEDIVKEHGEEFAQRYYKISTGKLVPIKIFIEAYNRERPVAEGSLKSRMSALKRLPFTYLHEYTPQAVGKYVTDLVEHSGLQISTINQRLLHFKALFQFLQYKGLVHHNPWHGSAIRQDRRYKSRAGSGAWSFDEVNRMITEVDDPEYGFAYMLLLYSGCRISEVTRMKVRDVHSDHWVVAVSKTEAGDNRKIFLPTRIMNGLHYRCADRQKDNYVMFQNVTGETENKRIGKITARANLILAEMFPEHKVEGRRNRKKTLHGLRKVATRTCEAEGIPPHVFHAMLGWSRGTVGFDVYSKAGDEVVKEAFAKLHAKFDEELKVV